MGEKELFDNDAVLGAGEGEGIEIMLVPSGFFSEVNLKMKRLEPIPGVSQIHPFDFVVAVPVEQEKGQFRARCDNVMNSIRVGQSNAPLW